MENPICAKYLSLFQAKTLFRLDRTAATKVAIHFTKRKLNSTEIKI